MKAFLEASRSRAVWWIGLVSFLAGAAAFFGSWVRPAWHDELYTLALARMPISDLVAALRVDSGPPLHYLICKGLFAVVGWTEGSDLGTFMVRLPSVVAYSALPWVFWLWARRRRANLFWGPLLALVWLPMLYFATEARVYALLALVNGTLWLLGPELVKGGRLRLVLFVCLAAALPLLHYAGIVSFICLPMLWFFISRDARRSFLLAYLLAAVPLALWFPVLVGAPGQSMGWVDAVAGPGRPGISTVQVLAPAGPFPALFEPPAGLAPPWLSMIALVALVLGCMAGVRVRRDQGDQDRFDDLDISRLLLALLPVALLGILAIVGVPAYFAGRSESMVWLVVVGLAAAAVGSFPGWLRLAVIGPYVAIALWTVGSWIGGLSDRPESVGVQTGQALATEYRQGDEIVVAGLWQLQVEHGLAQARLVDDNTQDASVVVRTLPASQRDHPGWLDLEAAMSRGLSKEARAIEAEGRGRSGRLWLVWSPGLPLEQTVFPVFQGWHRERVVATAIIAVDLLSPPVGSDDG